MKNAGLFEVEGVGGCFEREIDGRVSELRVARFTTQCRNRERVHDACYSPEAVLGVNNAYKAQHSSFRSCGCLAPHTRVANFLGHVEIRKHTSEASLPHEYISIIDLTFCPSASSYRSRQMARISCLPQKSLLSLPKTSVICQIVRADSSSQDLHIRKDSRQMPICTLPIAMKIFFDPDSCSQS